MTDKKPKLKPTTPSSVPKQPLQRGRPKGSLHHTAPTQRVMGPKKGK